MPLDPFVLFLLPPLLSMPVWQVWFVFGVAILLGAGVPWILRSSQSGMVRIDRRRCLGCELCAVDCPYLALELEGPVMRVDDARCVGCGICLGSCPFGALSVPGIEPPVAPSLAGREIVLTCAAAAADGGSDRMIVSCTGMMHPQVLDRMIAAGVEDIEVESCGPGDCRYGIGALLAAESIASRRDPYHERVWVDLVDRGWRSPERIRSGERRIPGRSWFRALGVSGRPWAALGATVVVVSSMVATALVTGLPFERTGGGGELVIVVDHPVVSADAVPELSLVIGHRTRTYRDGLHIRDGRIVGYVVVPLRDGVQVRSAELVQGDVILARAAQPIEIVEGERAFFEFED